MFGFVLFDVGRTKRFVDEGRYFRSVSLSHVWVASLVFVLSPALLVRKLAQLALSSKKKEFVCNFLVSVMHMLHMVVKLSTCIVSLLFSRIRKNLCFASPPDDFALQRQQQPQQLCPLRATHQFPGNSKVLHSPLTTSPQTPRPPRKSITIILPFQTGVGIVFIRRTNLSRFPTTIGFFALQWRAGAATGTCTNSSSTMPWTRKTT